MAQDRFETIWTTKKLTTQTSVLRDRDTGVCYLFHFNGTAGGLTTMMTADGNPLVVTTR